MLGRLEKVELRKEWPDEARDFTPWLAQEQNIVLLGEAIGLELEVRGTEQAVGPFRADIVCRVVGYSSDEDDNDSLLLIENQFGNSDHDHLGKLLTYASGLDTVTVVWVSETITDEHRTALDWLNKITDERFNFFGLEIELWKIGESPVAPKFNIVSQPNDWARRVAESARRGADLSELQLIQLEYWSSFASYLKESGSQLRIRKPQPQQWMDFSLGKTGISLSAVMSSWNSISNRYDGGEIRAAFYIGTKNAKQIFEILANRKAEFEKAAGEPLDWFNPENKLSAQVRLRRSADVLNRDDWQSEHEWLKLKLEKLQTVFGPMIKDLP